ncbi:MAG: hypothetical protein H6711_19310 [Myxococcales bacterium]|nr:hypothetical protein [Myxococcales bacterium]
MSPRVVLAVSLVFALVAGAKSSHGQEAAAAPAPAPAPAATPASSADSGKTPRVRVGELRRGMEQDLAEIGKIAQKARRDGDMVKVACTTDKQDRAEGVMDVATPEIAVLQSKSSDTATKGFASQKLRAAALNLGKLLDEARACMGAPASRDQGSGDNAVDIGDLDPDDPTPAANGGPLPPPPLQRGEQAASPVR